MLGISDLKQVIERLVGNQNHLSDNEMKQLIQSVLNEADLDDDGALSFPEFEHIIDKSSDFIKWVRFFEYKPTSKRRCNVFQSLISSSFRIRL